jgi:predicted aspartyl protease
LNLRYGETEEIETIIRASDLPRIEFINNKGTLVSLIDSGAQIGCIEKATAQELGLDIQSSTAILRGANGAYLGLAERTKVFLRFSSTVAVHYTLLVVPNLVEKCIIGANFLKHLNAELTFRLNCLEITWGKVTQRYPYSHCKPGLHLDATEAESEIKQPGIWQCDHKADLPDTMVLFTIK